MLLFLCLSFVFTNVYPVILWWTLSTVVLFPVHVLWSLAATTISLLFADRTFSTRHPLVSSSQVP
ncbi:hypothetical protein BJX76DRAFT_324072 [Aspergillus varians]